MRQVVTGYSELLSPEGVQQLAEGAKKRAACQFRAEGSLPIQVLLVMTWNPVTGVALNKPQLGLLEATKKDPFDSYCTAARNAARVTKAIGAVTLLPDYPSPDMVTLTCEHLRASEGVQMWTATSSEKTLTEFLRKDVDAEYPLKGLLQHFQ